MKQIDLNDFVVEILHDFEEIESMMRVLKDSAYNENGEITLKDFGNALEILITKMRNTKMSLDKYIDTAFRC